MRVRLRGVPNEGVSAVVACTALAPAPHWHLHRYPRGMNDPRSRLHGARLLDICGKEPARFAA